VSELGPRLLVVEDEQATRHSLVSYLKRRDYRVEEACSAGEALAAWDAGRPDAILLDLGLPDLDGVDLIRRIRREAATPIIVLSARGEERDRIAGLEAGADDYLAKPFAVDELNARIRAVLRRTGGTSAQPDGRLRLGPIEFDPVQHRVEVDGQQLRLTPREYELLKVMLSNQGRLVTRERLLRTVWGLAYADASEYVHVYVSRLRRKLAEAAGQETADRLFTTEPGIGYRVADEVSLREGLREAVDPEIV
jgi:two-component system, OmpR family, KDP operon response regulator KdpE